MGNTGKNRKSYWAALRLHDPELFEKLSLEYRKKHAHKIRQRVKTWKKVNRERYNAWQRSAYEKAKA